MYAYVFLQVEQYLLFIVRELQKYPLQQLLLFSLGMMGEHHSNCLQPEDMVFNQKLVESYSEIKVQVGRLLEE